MLKCKKPSGELGGRAGAWAVARAGRWPLRDRELGPRAACAGSLHARWTATRVRRRLFDCPFLEKFPK